MASRRVAIAILLSNLVVSKAHNNIIENLLSFGRTDLVIFTDKKDISETLDLKALKTPFKIFNVLDVWPEWTPNICPTGNDTQYPYQLDPPFYSRPHTPRYHTIVVDVKEIAKVITIFDRTVLKCTHFFEPGIYNIENRFLFLADHANNLGEFAENIFNSSANIANHR